MNKLAFQMGWMAKRAQDNRPYFPRFYEDIPNSELGSNVLSRLRYITPVQPTGGNNYADQGALESYWDKGDIFDRNKIIQQFSEKAYNNPELMTNAIPKKYYSPVTARSDVQQLVNKIWIASQLHRKDDMPLLSQMQNAFYRGTNTPPAAVKK